MCRHINTYKYCHKKDLLIEAIKHEHTTYMYTSNMYITKLFISHITASHIHDMNIYHDVMSHALFTCFNSLTTDYAWM